MTSRRSTRARWGRVVLVLASATVTTVAVLGGAGVLPVERDGAVAAERPTARLATRATPTAATPAADAPTTAPSPDAPTPGTAAPGADPTALPAGSGSGSGRRVVFSESAQRVWLVTATGTVRRTHLVSGSLTDNLRPGTYEVWSRSRWAVGIDDSGVMEYFVRFAHGKRAAIGFHSIPTKDGEPLQTRAQLGTPQSHGCIRQALPDAVATWRFATTGTTVVVV
ncbi:L,D-transpeptidase [Nocardioides sediminis]|uniref:L,D-transpeptidase n=1 Tax=Nocardioides sediminis TaxID=433648 RepID=UPI000D308222|nr:L,D-transpeptidase [Nocardioides sediminis]